MPSKKTPDRWRRHGAIQNLPSARDVSIYYLRVAQGNKASSFRSEVVENPTRGVWQRTCLPPRETVRDGWIPAILVVSFRMPSPGAAGACSRTTMRLPFHPQHRAELRPDAPSDHYQQAHPRKPGADRTVLRELFDHVSELGNRHAALVRRTEEAHPDHLLDFDDHARESLPERRIGGCEVFG